ncbi:MAG: ABC transporter permease [Nocardioidaceae bacterium]|mgnify:CR=1 FL=1
MTSPSPARRLMRAVVAVALVVVVTFMFVHIVPGDPARAILGPQASAESVSALRDRLGLDQPILTQFVDYIAGALRGDLGTSVAEGVPVTSLMASRAAPTLALIVLAALLTVVLTVPAAALAARRPGSVVDHVVRTVPLLGLGLPAFWFALVLIQVFAVRLGWFPAGGYGGSVLQRLHALTLPALVTAVSILPFTIQSLRVAMVDSYEADYVAAARARGVPARQIRGRYVFRNASIPAVVVLGLNMGWLVGNTLIVEKVFAIPGVGALLVDATLSRDFPVVQGLALVIALLVIGTNLLTELARVSLDPRLRHSQETAR